MTTTVTITGTGVPHLAPGRAGPGVLIEYGDIRLQFDAGRATALRLTEAGVKMKQLTALFITHHHSDHLTGLTDLLFARWVENQVGFVPLPVIAPLGPSVHFLEHMMDPWERDIADRVSHVGRNDHPAANVIGFDPGPAAHAPVEVWADEATGVRVLARTVHEAFRRDALLAFVEVAPQLVHIAAYHADTVELGALAERISMPTVLLTHLIPSPGSGTTTKDDYVDDLRRGGYQGGVIVADDLTSVTLEAEPL